MGTPAIISCVVGWICQIAVIVLEVYWCVVWWDTGGLIMGILGGPVIAVIFPSLYWYKQGLSGLYLLLWGAGLAAFTYAGARRSFDKPPERRAAGRRRPPSAKAGFVLLMALGLAGCAHYPGEERADTVDCQELRGLQTSYTELKLAETAVATLNKRLHQVKSGDPAVAIKKASFAVNPQSELIPLVASHWTIALNVQYRIGEGAPAGKRSVVLEALDKSEARIAIGRLELNVKGSRTEAFLINGFGEAILGWLALASGLWPYGLRRLARSQGREVDAGLGCLAAVLLPFGTVILLHGIWMILKALFF